MHIEPKRTALGMQQEDIHPHILAPIRWLQQQGSNDNDDEDDDDERRRRQEHQHQHLSINSAHHVNRQSVQYLVDFVHNGEEQHAHHQISNLCFNMSSLSHPSDGGLNVFCDLFTNNTTLTRVSLTSCNVGSTQDATRLLAAFHSNRSIKDLTIRKIENLEGVALGSCISDLLQNMPQLQRLELGDTLTVDCVRAMQPGLRAIRRRSHLEILALSGCQLRNAGLCLLVNALVGNTMLELLIISFNGITSDGVDDITRLVQHTQLRRLFAGQNCNLFPNEHDMKNFIVVLRQHSTSLEQLQTGLDMERYPHQGEAAVAIANIMNRNVHLRRAKEILAPRQPRTGLPIASKSGLWCRVMAKLGEPGLDEPPRSPQHFPTRVDDYTPSSSDDSDDNDDNNNSMNDLYAKNATSSREEEERKDELQRKDIDDNDTHESFKSPESPDYSVESPDYSVNSPNDNDEDESVKSPESPDYSVNNPDASAPTYPGASAIFKIFQARPAILEYQLPRPSAVAAAASSAAMQRDEGDDSDGASSRRKRRRID